jgi:hypothetical protein
MQGGGGPYVIQSDASCNWEPAVPRQSVCLSGLDGFHSRHETGSPVGLGVMGVVHRMYARQPRPFFDRSAKCDVQVDVSGSTLPSLRTLGGSDTSMENNNVYGIEPKTYLEGQSPTGEPPSQASTCTVMFVTF